MDVKEAEGPTVNYSLNAFGACLQITAINFNGHAFVDYVRIFYRMLSQKFALLKHCRLVLSVRAMQLSGPFSVTRWKNYFSKIWPFRKIKIWPNAWNICHGRYKMFTSTKLTLKLLPKTFTILPKWRNFAKSGHTGSLFDRMMAQHIIRLISFCKN